MISLRIDNREISVETGSTVLDAARRLGVDIPTMCYLEEAGAFTSCMICLVHEGQSNSLIPACSHLAEEGMQVTTSSEQIREARRMALELLLSDHSGDCEAPCQVTCPAHMNIPLMNRLLARGKAEEALRVVMHDIPLPSILGYICPAPCEGACKRKEADQAVSICLLKRYCGDQGNYPPPPILPFGPKEQRSRKVAVVGAGPAGLSALYYLAGLGYECTLIDRGEAPGGNIRINVPADRLPTEALDRETYYLSGLAAEYRADTVIDRKAFTELQDEFDALLLATGEMDEQTAGLGPESGPKGLVADRQTYQTSVAGVFAAGAVLRPAKMAVRSVGQGKEAAFSIHQYLSGMPVTGLHKKFNSRLGKLAAPEINEYLKESVRSGRLEPEGGISRGFGMKETRTEALRCMHCDCREIDNCRLRDLSDEYQAVQKTFRYGERKPARKKWVHESVVHEPGKCIKCGICVRLTEKEKEKYGFTFIGRGFDVEIGIAFDEDLRHSLVSTAEKVARACPTGALSVTKNKTQDEHNE